MQTFIALFRGINVGGKNILPMKDLAATLESMGCKHVKTYIQSGNVIFQSTRKETRTLARDITSAIQEHNGFAPWVLLLDLAQLRKAIKCNPFDEAKGNTVHYYFLAANPENPDLDALLQLKSASEAFKLVNLTFYLFAPDGIGRSKLAANVERCLGVQATARNGNTVNKLAALAG